MKFAAIACLAMFASTLRTAADEPKKTNRPISEADSVLAMYADDWGFGRSGGPKLILAVWPDGHAVWSRERIEGGPPYFEGTIEAKRFADLLSQLETDGLFEDKKLNRGYLGPESKFTTIFVKSDKLAVKMQSWHELYEATGKMVAAEHGVRALDGKRRLDVLHKTSAEYLYFRFVWAETRGRLSDLLPAEGRPVEGRPVMKAGELSWEEAAKKDGTPKK